MSNTTHIVPVLVLLSAVKVEMQLVPQKIVILCHAIWASLTQYAILPYSTIFCSSFAQLRFGHKRSTSNGQCDNVILMEKGVDAIHSPHASLWTRSVSRSIMQKDTVQYCLYLYLFFTCYRSFLHPRAAPVSPVSRYGNDSQQRGIGFVLTNCKM